MARTSRVAYRNHNLKVNKASEEYAKGVSTNKGGGWWRGCPHCYDTQEWHDWQAGWHDAENSREK